MKYFERAELFRYLATPLTKSINHEFIEKWSRSLWFSGLVKPLNKPNGETKEFPMMLPPPNITGNLHLGHALTVSIQDAIVRNRRMRGFRTDWIPGFDHAGLSTQNIVENLLMKEMKLTRQEYGQSNFIQYANKWKEQKTKEMKYQLDRLGLDLNYEREFFTTDEKSSHAVHTAFRHLFEKQLIYRQVKSLPWSRSLGTTLSDVEVTTCDDGTKRCIRTNELLEMRDVTQWFIDCKDLARRSVEAVERLSIKILPNSYINTWGSWLVKNGSQDWCISRQSWWGHSIPAYRLRDSLDEQQSWIVASSLEEARAKLNSDDVIQDTDVLDTWFSSSLLPLTISGWPNKVEFGKSLESQRYPLPMMETGFDILTFWVTKMVMMSIALVDKIPFNLVLLHGMICDSKGKKMSKSKGNVIDPMDLIEGKTQKEIQARIFESKENGLLDDQAMKDAIKNLKKVFPNGLPCCGADGLRLYLLSQDFQQEVVRVQMPQIEKILKLMNKLWNIVRFTISIIETHRDKLCPKFIEDLSDLDKSISDECDIKLMNDLERCSQIGQMSFETTYKLHHFVTAMEYFWITNLSSEYVPKVREALSDDKCDTDIQVRKLETLIACLITSLRMTHPLIPHTTEFLYQKLRLSIENQEFDFKLIVSSLYK